METTPEQVELEPITKVLGYLAVLQGGDVDAYRATANTLKGVFDVATDDGIDPFATMMTSAANALEKLHTDPTHSNVENSRFLRVTAARNLVTPMVTGLRLPIKDFGPVINRVIGTISAIDEDKDPRAARRLIKKDLIELSEQTGDSAVPRLRRIAEAYKWVDDPRRLFRYGRMAVRAARAEREVDDLIHGRS